jgi:branched-chain amino acid transport system permease protein
MIGSGDILTPLVMGLMLGGVYALIALGLSVIFGVMKLINLAHGDLVILGSYLAYALMFHLRLDPVLSLVIGMPAMFALGFGIQKYLVGRAFGISAEAPLIIAFGISLVIQNGNQIIWTPLSRSLNTPYSLMSFQLGHLQFPLSYLLGFIAGIIVMVTLRECLTRTYLGMAITAAAQDKKAAQLMGINTHRIYGYAFGIAGASAAVAGVFLGMMFPFTPTSGISLLTIAFGTVIIGGLGSMLGTLIGGIILGIVQTVGGYLFGPATQMLMVYMIVLFILAIKPQGLLGR